MNNDAVYTVDVINTIQVTIGSESVSFADLIPLPEDADDVNDLTADQLADTDLIVLTAENAMLRYAYTKYASPTFGHPIPVLNEFQVQFKRNIRQVNLASVDESLVTISFIRLTRK